MPHTLYRPLTPVAQLLWTPHVKAYENGVGHVFRDRARAEAPPGQHVEDYEMHLVLADAQVPVQRMLDEILTPLPKATVVNWTPWFWLYGALIVIPFAAMFFTYRARRRLYSYKAREIGAAMLFASPWLIG